MRFFDERAAYDRAVLKHILEVYEVAVMHMLSEIIGVVEMDYAGFVRVDDLFGQKNPLGDVLAHFARHIIPLNAVHGRVFVGVLLLYLFVVTFDKAENLLVGGVGFSDELTGITISYIFSRHVERLEIHDLVFHDILNLFDA